MPCQIAHIMDPIESINIAKDSTFAMMEEAQKRGHQNIYILPENLFYREGKVYGKGHRIEVFRDTIYYRLQAEEVFELSSLDAVSLRKDPPFNMAYIYTTYLLELVDTLVMNHPTSVRNANEKLYALHFPELIPPTLVSANRSEIKAFVKEYQKTVIKPIDAKGGEGIFILQAGDPNLNSIVDTMSREGRQMILVQRFIPEAKAGDKRLLFVNGDFRAAFQRVPAADDFRANLNAGAQAIACELTARDQELIDILGPALKAAKLYFVGLDLIGDYLIEINVTSPTGVQEAKKLTGIDVAADIIDFIESRT